MASNRTVLTDGTRSIPLDQLPAEAWRVLVGTDTDADTGEGMMTLYRLVPPLYRGVNLLAGAVSAMPFDIIRNRKPLAEDSEDYQRVASLLRTLLLRTERALVLHGASYARLDSNRVRTRIEPRWLAPGSIRPVFDQVAGLTGFMRTVGGQQVALLSEDVLYVWLPSETTEIGPGISPALVALQSSAVLRMLATFVADYYKRGGLKFTLLSVEGSPSQADLDALRTWWGRVMRGMRSAWDAVTIRSTVKPTVVGSSLNESFDTDLIDQVREDVGVALGIPTSLLYANAANYATAQQDALNFYNQTVLPHCGLIEEALNAQWLARIGLRLEFHPERLEVYQRAEQEKAQALQSLVGQPILTVDEARAALGYEPLPVVETSDAAPQQREVQVLVTDIEQGIISKNERRGMLGMEGIDDSADTQRRALQTGLVLVQQMVAMGMPLRLAWQLAGLNSDDLADLPEPAAPVVVPAPSEQVTPADTAPVRRMPPDATPVEQELYALLERMFADAVPGIADAILAEIEPDLAAVAQQMGNELTPALARQFAEQARQQFKAIGIPMDADTLAGNAQSWASSYVPSRIKMIDETTRQMVRGAVEQFRATSGMTQQDLIDLLRPAFSAARAENIAVTEVTSAASAGISDYKRWLEDEHDMRTVRVWQTNADDLVCQICGPLNGLTDAIWGEQYPDGPPAHGRCRCSVALETEGVAYAG